MMCDLKADRCGDFRQEEPDSKFQDHRQSLNVFHKRLKTCLSKLPFFYPLTFLTNFFQIYTQTYLIECNILPAFMVITSFLSFIKEQQNFMQNSEPRFSQLAVSYLMYFAVNQHLRELFFSQNKRTLLRFLNVQTCTIHMSYGEGRASS